jgi:hypothetical protein
LSFLPENPASSRSKVTKTLQKYKPGFLPVLRQAEQLSLTPVHASQTMMRATLPVALLLSTLLVACATDKDVLTAKDIPQSGTLKVHPGLIKSPAPVESQPVAAPPPTAPAASPEAPVEPAATR